MKYLIFILMLIAGICVVSALTVSDYHYELDNGTVLETVNGWDFVRHYTRTDTITEKDKRMDLYLEFVDTGRLLAGKSGVTIINSKGDSVTVDSGEESFKLKPDDYTLLVKLPLINSNGFISYKAEDIETDGIHYKEITFLLHDIELTVMEEDKNMHGLAQYMPEVHTYEGEKAKFSSYPGIFRNGEEIEPDESINDFTHRIKSGKYDMRIEMDMSWAGYKYIIMLNDFEMKKNTVYIPRINLNASSVKMDESFEDYPSLIHFYPIGTANEIGLTEKPELEVFKIESPRGPHVCPPGGYDVLLNYDYGARYEWKKNVNFFVGDNTVIEP
ncbi:MAG: hypothetical protein R6U31_07545 [bacterium]